MQTQLRRCALLVVDVQQGFEDPWWGRRNNERCDENIAALVSSWAAHRRPVVYVQHASRNPDSPLHPDNPGHVLKPYLQEHEPDLRVTKSVNSCFYGSPDLDAWLRGHEISQLAICGITTNHCCETTARMAGNLGYEVLFVTDATHTFDRQTPQGEWISADDLARVTSANLHGEFATVVSTEELVAAAGDGSPRN